MPMAALVSKSVAVVCPWRATAPAAFGAPVFRTMSGSSLDEHRIASQPKNQNPLKDSRRPHEIRKDSYRLGSH